MDSDVCLSSFTACGQLKRQGPLALFLWLFGNVGFVLLLQIVFHCEITLTLHNWGRQGRSSCRSKLLPPHLCIIYLFWAAYQKGTQLRRSCSEQDQLAQTERACFWILVTPPGGNLFRNFLSRLWFPAPTYRSAPSLHPRAIAHITGCSHSLMMSSLKWGTHFKGKRRWMLMLNCITNTSCNLFCWSPRLLCPYPVTCPSWFHFYKQFQNHTINC